MLTRPISRALRVAISNNTITNGVGFSGGCPGDACTWYTQNTRLPPSTQVTNCNRTMRTMGVSCGDHNPSDYPCTPNAAVPWCAPGYAQVKSPCGIFSGGWGSNGRDMRDLPSSITPAAVWQAGAEVEVAWTVVANHGGGYIYRLCPSDSSLSEECFQENILPFRGNVQILVDLDGNKVSEVEALRLATGTFPAGSEWTRNPIPMELGIGRPIPGLPGMYGRGPFPYSIQDRVMVPADLPTGNYVLSFRWDAEQTKQVWSQCSDVHIVNPKQSKMSVSNDFGIKRTPPSNVCLGSSVGLDVDDCNAWGALYDALDGPNWPKEWDQGCAGQRADPCGCNNDWRKSIVCDTKRDYLRITELYIMGEQVSGVLPKTISNLTELVSVSFVGTSIKGSLPSSLGEMAKLTMIWFDHNALLGGEIPQSFSQLKDVSAFELHRSAFAGYLPNMDYLSIADCTLADMVFKCPLPPGAEACGAQCQL